jgi:hypothetical protein
VKEKSRLLPTIDESIIPATPKNADDPLLDRAHWKLKTEETLEEKRKNRVNATNFPFHLESGPLNANVGDLPPFVGRPHRFPNPVAQRVEDRRQAAAHEALLGHGTLRDHAADQEQSWRGGHALGTGANGRVVLWVKIDDQDHICDVSHFIPPISRTHSIRT